MNRKVLLGILLSMSSVHTYASSFDDALAVKILYGEGAEYSDEKYKSNVDVDVLPFLDAKQKHGLNLKEIFENYSSKQRNPFSLLVADYVLYQYEYNQLHMRSPLKNQIQKRLLLCENEIIALTSLTSRKLIQAVYDDESRKFRKAYYKKISDQEKEMQRKRFKAMMQKGVLEELF